MGAPTVRRRGSTRTTIKARRVRFTFQASTTPRHFVEDDIAMSHFLAMMSAAFPAGEEAFIRSVQRNQDKVTDAHLKRQIKGFVGQEMTHGLEHRNLNETLREMGYPTHLVDGAVRRFERIEKYLPDLVPLALTAAAEHYTATLAERVLANEEVQALAYDEEVKNLLLWHALEELEHKSVAFDVFRASDGGEALRIAAMAFVLTTIIPVLGLSLLISLSRDPAALNVPKTIASVARLPRNPALANLTLPLLRYLKPGFHPDHVDTQALLARWQSELFGADGQLNDHLRARVAQ